MIQAESKNRTLVPADSSEGKPRAGECLGTGL